jgi:hypothetical protein
VWLLISDDLAIILDAATLTGRALLLDVVGPCAAILSAREARALGGCADLVGGVSL